MVKSGSETLAHLPKITLQLARNKGAITSHHDY